MDAEVGYQFNLVKLALGVRNLFDTYPDQPSSDRDTGLGGTSAEFNNNFGTFPWAAASPFGYNGRFAYAQDGDPAGLVGGGAAGGRSGRAEQRATVIPSGARDPLQRAAMPAEKIPRCARDDRMPF